MEAKEEKKSELEKAARGSNIWDVRRGSTWLIGHAIAKKKRALASAPPVRPEKYMRRPMTDESRTDTVVGQIGS